MYQVRAPILDPIGISVQLLLVPSATAMPQGWCGFLIGTGTGKTKAIILHHLEELKWRFIEQFKRGVSVEKATMPGGLNGKPAIVLSSSASGLADEVSLAAQFVGPGGEFIGSTEAILASLEQCYEVIRETRGMTGIPD